MSAYTRSGIARKRNIQRNLESSSSDEDLTASPNRRKKVQKWLDNSLNDSPSDKDYVPDKWKPISDNRARAVSGSEYDTEYSEESVIIRRKSHRNRAVVIESDESSESSDASIKITKKSLRKRVRARAVLDSDSDTESSDESVIINRKRNWNRGVKMSRVFESESSESSSESAIIATNSANAVQADEVRNRISRRRIVSDDDESVAITDDDNIVVDSESSSKSVSLSLTTGACGKEITKDRATDSDTSSQDSTEIDDSYSDSFLSTCPICFSPFIGQKLAIPSSCSHLFCKICIIRWSKNSHTCPLDRKPYNALHICRNYDDQAIIGIYFPPTPLHLQWDYDEDMLSLTVCEVCGLGTDEEHLLLCDGCDYGFHLSCLIPPLTEVPEGEWYCAICAEL